MVRNIAPYTIYAIRNTQYESKIRVYPVILSDSGLVLADPVLEVLGQDLDVFLFHDVGYCGRADF